MDKPTAIRLEQGLLDQADELATRLEGTSLIDFTGTRISRSAVIRRCIRYGMERLTNELNSITERNHE